MTVFFIYFICDSATKHEAFCSEALTSLTVRGTWQRHDANSNWMPLICKPMWWPGKSDVIGASSQVLSLKFASCY